MVVNFSRTTAPASSPVTTAEAKAQMRVTSTDSDTYIASILLAASDLVEDKSGRSLMAQTWKLELSSWARRIWLPRAAPLGAVSSIKYYDTAGDLQTLSSSVYGVSTISEPAYVFLLTGQTWPVTQARPNAIVIEYTTGVSDAANVSRKLVHAVKLVAAHWFENREATGALAPEIAIGVADLCGDRVTWREPECA